MLKIRNDYNLDQLKDFGFMLEPEKSYYYKVIGEDIIVTVQKTKNDRCIRYREVSIDCQYGTFISGLDIIYDLILLDIIEKVGDKENE